MFSNCLNFQGVWLHVWILVIEAVEDKMNLFNKKITNVSKILPLIIVIIIIAILCLELAGILSIIN